MNDNLATFDGDPKILLGLAQFINDDDTKAVVIESLDLLARWGRGETPSETEWSAAIEKLNVLHRNLGIAQYHARSYAMACDTAGEAARPLTLEDKLRAAKCLTHNFISQLFAARSLDFAPAGSVDLPAREKHYLAVGSKLAKCLQPASPQAEP